MMFATDAVDVMARRPRKVIDLSGGQLVGARGRSSFSGTAYVAGVKVTGLNADATKPWVKCDLAAATATEEAGPPPDPFPANEEWHYKNETYGDIHESRT